MIFVGGYVGHVCSPSLGYGSRVGEHLELWSINASILYFYCHSEAVLLKLNGYGISSCLRILFSEVKATCVDTAALTSTALQTVRQQVRATGDWAAYIW